MVWNALPANICSTIDPKLFITAVKGLFFSFAFDITVRHITFIDSVIHYWTISVWYFSIHQMTVVWYCIVVYGMGVFSLQFVVEHCAFVAG